jgi:hypothetical protein
MANQKAYNSPFIKVGEHQISVKQLLEWMV